MCATTKYESVRLEVDRRRRQHHAGQPAEQEREQEADREQQRRASKLRLPAPHRADPVEELDAGRHGDEHRHEREERQRAPRRWRTCGGPTRRPTGRRSRASRTRSALYPNTGRRENTANISVTTPKNGRTRMYTSGWPKNQNRCCQRIGVRRRGRRRRCGRRGGGRQNSITPAAVSTGNASSTSTLVTSMFHVKIGMRNIVMPGRAHA